MNQSSDKFGIVLLMHLFDQYLELRRRPLPMCNFDIRNRILENVLSDDFVVKDVYSSVVGRPYDIWMLSGETPESFHSLIELVNTDITVHGNQVVSLKNRVLLTLIWLRQYPTYSLLVFNLRYKHVNCEPHYQPNMDEIMGNMFPDDPLAYPTRMAK